MLNINTKTSTLSWETLLPTRTKKSKCTSTSPMRIQLLPPLRILMVLTLAPFFARKKLLGAIKSLVFVKDANASLLDAKSTSGKLVLAKKACKLL